MRTVENVGYESNGTPENHQAVTKIVIEALIAAKNVHDQLGASGEESIEKNLSSIGNRMAEGVQMALKADWECEEAVLDILRQSDIPIRVIAEEHDVVDLSDKPGYLGVLDGLDGTGVYRANRGIGRYGTMLGVFEGTDPHYRDYISCGIMEHSTGRLYIATRGEGAFVIENGIATPIRTSGITDLDPEMRIWIDTAYGITNKTFTKKVRPFRPHWEGSLTSGSLAVHHADVASGTADLAVEVTRKGVIEEAISYGLITEAGGVVVDVDGASLADKKYLEFGQDEKIPLILAATPELAQATVAHLKSGFEESRAGFFANFIRQHKKDYEFLTSSEFGLAPKPKVKGVEAGIYVTNRSRENEDMRNVAKHGILQAVAMDIIADALELSPQDKADLVSAAFIHDFYKVAERNKDKAKNIEGQTNEAIVEAEHEAEAVLAAHGYNERVVEIVGSVGHNNCDKIMSPDCPLSDKIMFLIDAATNNEVIIGARKKTNIMRSKNKEIEKTGDYEKLDQATDYVEAELAAMLGLQDPQQLYDWLNSQIYNRIKAWGKEHHAGNPNGQ